MSTLDTGAGYPHAGTGFRMQERWSEDVAAGHAAVGWSRSSMTAPHLMGSGCWFERVGDRIKLKLIGM